MYSAICSGSRSCPGLEATCLTAICIPPAAFQIPSPLDIFYLVSVILQQLFDSFSGFFLLNRQTNWIHTLPPFQTSGICPLFSNTFLRIRYTIPSSARYKRLFSRVPVKTEGYFPRNNFHPEMPFLPQNRFLREQNVQKR